MNITLYTTTTCVECVSIKRYLEEKGLSYTELLVDKSNEAAKEMVNKSGQKSVPVLVIRLDDGYEKIFVGHDMEQIVKTINAFMSLRGTIVTK